jgi:hypothetical protein
MLVHADNATGLTVNRVTDSSDANSSASINSLSLAAGFMIFLWKLIAPAPANHSMPRGFPRLAVRASDPDLDAEE